MRQPYKILNIPQAFIKFEGLNLSVSIAVHFSFEEMRVEVYKRKNDWEEDRNMLIEMLDVIYS